MRNPVAARFRHSIGCLLILGASTFPAHAQRATLRGIVTDSAGIALTNAEVRIVAMTRATRTDTVGAFTITGLLPNSQFEVSVRRLGYQQQFLQVTLIGNGGDPIRIKLVSEAMTLSPVEIDAMAGHPYFREFEQRRGRGLGTFITRDQIVLHNSSYPSDVFRTLPGMRLIRVGGGTGVRFARSSGTRRGGDCVPTIWVDGQRAPGMEIDDLRSGDIQAMEIYRGSSTTPAQFVTAGATQCGTIVVWTRRRQ